VRVLVIGAHGDAFGHALVEANCTRVKFGETPRLVVSKDQVCGVSSRICGGCAGRTFYVKMVGPRAVVTHIQNDTERQGFLNIQVPHLHVRQGVMRIERVVADGGRSWKTIREARGRGGKGAGAYDLAARVDEGVGLLVGKGRLMRHGAGEVGVFSHRVVHAVPGTQNHLLDFGNTIGDAEARREGFAIWIYE